MTERKPGKYVPTLHSMPWFPNGKVASIKYSYSVSGLTPSPYPIRKRSVQPNSNPNLKTTLREFPNVDQKKPIVAFREFREYNFIRKNEIIVTIEHCDGCEKHSGTTRHDPQKYLRCAQLIKSALLSKYSVVKVILKPISSATDLSMSQRLGAFEVQVVANFDKGLRKGTLHSKLTSQKWPDVNKVISEVAEYLPTFCLGVKVVSEDTKEPLPNMKVKVRPKELQIQAPATSRPRSAYTGPLRPRSAATFKNISRRTSRISLSSKKQSQSTYCTTDITGTAFFASLCLNTYEVEVEGSDYKSTMEVFNATEYSDFSSTFHITVELLPSNICEVMLNLRDAHQRTFVSGAEVKLCDEANKVYFAEEAETGTFVSRVSLGNYQLLVSAEGYEPLAKSIQLKNTSLCITEYLKNTQLNIQEIAEKLGIDPIRHKEYLWIAEECSKAPVPSPWEALYDKQGRLKCYQNPSTFRFCFDNPNIEIYREKFLKESGFYTEKAEEAKAEEYSGEHSQGSSEALKEESVQEPLQNNEPNQDPPYTSEDPQENAYPSEEPTSETTVHEDPEIASLRQKYTEFAEIIIKNFEFAESYGMSIDLNTKQSLGSELEKIIQEIQLKKEESTQKEFFEDWENKMQDLHQKLMSFKTKKDSSSSSSSSESSYEFEFEVDQGAKEQVV